ncbi:uncharacterized protein LOC130510672 [Raphanus sativus]|uniref:Uncharacterized protein LOC130507261 n=1 Tax=Raphanus sativus TaxID=3726 RepID=A0A9W3DHB4_RAPSA|nr:uncharacterized protein LOC130507261 [Raphanus sativus]XP_056863195.1 uncharacterized protein LOC130510672 [Raphanus sativus]
MGACAPLLYHLASPLDPRVSPCFLPICSGIDPLCVVADVVTDPCVRFSLVGGDTLDIRVGNIDYKLENLMVGIVKTHQLDVTLPVKRNHICGTWQVVSKFPVAHSDLPSFISRLRKRTEPAL